MATRKASPTRTRKPAVKVRSAEEPAAVARPVTASVKATVKSEAGADTGQGQPLRRPELVDRVVEVSGMKKKDVKPIVEAMLHVLGEAFAANEEMILHPLGRVKIDRQKDAGNATVIRARIRRNANAVDKAKDPLADPEE
ncbi:DNA-binding protein [Rhodovulum imhoffii]|uniref:DNA-binding protein n=1 Tax=Rhodovulum imhoffii TaxID=365340 RepID=A0A2T5BNV5_9RHOB|nr:HU family DNA-binding protein [Rhodovulum imhoffii]MBK5933834.1 hypothetical protein [Rhodovulum imhoffii]PTN00674.1 DNA-binding protein [Rhodovulum imhoffii]